MRHPCPGLRSLLLFSVGVLASGPVQAAEMAGAKLPCGASNVRWTGVSNRLYLSGDVTCTLTDIRRFAPEEAPLTLVDPTNRIWLLGANLVLENGATLVLDGARGGDVAELRLRSNNTTSVDAFVELRAQWGNLLIQNTRITSWNEHDGAPDTEYDTYGRAFVRVVSYLDVDGTPRQSRMDVLKSDIGYLGYYEAESYGLVWKVRDTTGPEVFDAVDVVGDLVDSKIHHNYFGMYSYGAYGMNITGNEVYENVMYGIDPHDDSDALLIADNNIHHNGNHGFICSKRCDGLTVRDNVSSSNAQTGYMLHRAVENTVVESNLAENNGDAGFAIMDSHDNVLRNNIARGNKYGVRLSVGASDNLIEDNELSDNTLYGIYLYQGTDEPTINDGRPTGNLFLENEVRRSGSLAVRAADAHANQFVRNSFAESTDYAVFLHDATDNVFEENDLGGSYLLSKGLSSNAVSNTDVADVMLGDTTATITFTDGLGRVFLNPAGLPTAVDVESSSLTLTHADLDGVMRIDAVGLDVAPQGGDMGVNVGEWRVSSRTWTTTPGTAVNATFILTGLAPQVRHAVWVDGAHAVTVTTDANGRARFSHSVMEPHTFTVASQRRIRALTVVRGH